MKILSDHIILYDAACPMCKAYTKLFVKSGMLDEQGRAAYQQMPEACKHSVDFVRAVNEIALYNRKTGAVQYGVKSILLILSHSLPFLKPLFRLKPFLYGVDTLYKFISYNRRVMIPAKYDAHNKFYHDPIFNPTYQVLFLLFTWIVTAFILHSYSSRFGELVPNSSIYRQLAICGGQMVWQAAAMVLLNKHKVWDYLGNLMTISFAGGLLLVVLMMIGNLFELTNPYVYLLLFLTTAALMLLEHIRRTRILAISWLITVSWVMYRLVVLFILL